MERQIFYQRDFDETVDFIIMSTQTEFHLEMSSGIDIYTEQIRWVFFEFEYILRTFNEIVHNIS